MSYIVMCICIIFINNTRRTDNMYSSYLQVYFISFFDVSIVQILHFSM